MIIWSGGVSSAFRAYLHLPNTVNYQGRAIDDALLRISTSTLHKPFRKYRIEARLGKGRNLADDPSLEIVWLRLEFAYKLQLSASFQLLGPNKIPIFLSDQLTKHDLTI